MKNSSRLFFGWSLLVTLSSPLWAVGISVPYTGLDKFHFSYSASYSNVGITEPDPRIVEVRLEVKKPSLAVQVLRSAPMAADSSLLFEGSLNLEGLEQAGMYEISIVRKLSTGQEYTDYKADAELLGDTISGSLLFDETIDTDMTDPIHCGGVGVPEGLTLDLQEFMYTQGFIRVEGDLVFEAATFDQDDPVKLIFTDPVSFTSPPDAYYVLEGAGSSITLASKVTVVATDATLSFIRALDLYMTLVSTVHVLDSTVSMSFWDLLTHAEVQFSNCLFENLSLFLRDGDDFTFQGCTCTGSTDVRLDRNGGKALFEDSFFRSIVQFEGAGPVQCEFQACEFASWVFLNQRTGPTFEGCLFLDEIRFEGDSWATTSDPSPVIEGNFFMGRKALTVPLYSQKPTAKIEIGENYYGDPKGPRLNYFDSPLIGTRLFLDDRGAEVLMGFQGQEVGPLLSLDDPSETGPGERKDTEVSPQVWISDYLLGQNTISHTGKITSLVEGREALFSADISCSENSLSGVEIYLEVNGNRIDSTDPTKILHRDNRDYGGASTNLSGGSTFNFIIPQIEGTIDSLRVVADGKQISGFRPWEAPRTLLQTGNLPVEPAYDRDLNIVVQPVRLFLYGFTNTPAPAATALIQDLSDLIPAMFPISEKEIHFVPASPITFTGIVSNFAWIGTYSLVTGLTALLGSGRALWNVTSYAADDPEMRLDFVVGLVPPGGLGGAVEGANSAVDRGILLVDSSKPTAAIHEMGHGMGFYTDTEQYDQVPPDGREVEGATLFKTEDGYVPAFSGDRGRIRHMPSTFHSWYSNQGWIDVMGAQDVPVWPIPTTQTSFRNDLLNRLRLPEPKSRENKGQLPIGMRTLFVRGVAERVGDGTEDFYYRFVPGTLSAVPIDRGDQDAFVVADPPTRIEGQYEFRGFADDGQRLDFQAFQLIPNSGPDEQVDLWWATFVIANSRVNRYEIVSVQDGEEVMEYLPGNQVHNQILEPAVNSTLGQQVRVSWNAGITAAKSIGSATSPPLLHNLLYSENGGETWIGLAPFIEGASLEISTEAIRAGTDISLRLLSTDGLMTSVAQVDHLTIENRPPSVRIHSPQEGDQAEMGTAWSLYGGGFDLDDRQTVVGWWTSSIDGPLGPGNALEGIVLSPGTHQIVYSATDSKGLVGADSVQVTVGAGEPFDFALAEDSLRVRNPESNSSAGEVESLIVGYPHSAALRLRNFGTNSDLLLTLWLQQPAKAEILLASHQSQLDPFETVHLPAVFNVDEPGEYKFRGEVVSLKGEDPMPENNVRNWVFQASFQIPTPTVTVTPTPVVSPSPTPSQTPGTMPTPTQTANYDLDGDSVMTVNDLLSFSRDWGESGETVPADFSRDGKCDAADLLGLLGELLQ